jgi:NAD(P)H-dependent flavin oxidoreductase YrpB (nitropropane dioxygenase family)
MGWVADPGLVAATINAGGFGFLAGATLAPDELEPAIIRIKELSDKPFGINFHMFQPNSAQVVDLAIRHQVRAVSYGRGPSPSLISKLKKHGVVCMPTVGMLKHASKAVELGADIITIQGSEGGGHTGAVPTTVLLNQVLAADLKVPVVVAGGMSDGRALAAMLAWGASGIAMGTRFLLSSESPVPLSTKSYYLKCRAPERIRISTALDGLPQRMLENKFLMRIENASSIRKLYIAIRSALAYRRLSGASLKELLVSAFAMRSSMGLSIAQASLSANAPMLIQRAMVDGAADEGVLPGGQVAGAIDTLSSCAEIISSIVAESEERFKALGAS